MHPNLSFRGQNIFFFGGEAPPPQPLLSTPTEPRPLLTEITNTPLLTPVSF